MQAPENLISLITPCPTPPSNVKAVLQDTYGPPEVTRMEGSRPLRATALQFATSESSRVFGSAVVETVDQE